jgi:uracil-DNA glycosylase
MDVRIEPGWRAVLATEFEQPYFKRLAEQVRFAYQTETVYPPPKHIFEAFNQTPLSTLKVVILGQDPYHGPHQAHGLAFSVQDGVALPPSLQNIYKEVASDIGITRPTSGNLTRWAQQGVFLLNSTLTVRGGAAGAHQTFGWETFTDKVIETISQEREQVVFLLWGAFAIAKRRFIDESKHLILTAPHPSPLSAHRGFFGCKHFSQTNDYSQRHGLDPIDWS